MTGFIIGLIIGAAVGAYGMYVFISRRIKAGV